MKRRKFLGLIGGAALAPVVGKAALNDGVTLKSIAHPPTQSMSSGFGLAPVKREGSTIVSDDGVTWKELDLAGINELGEEVNEIIQLDGANPVISKHRYR